MRKHILFFFWISFFFSVEVIGQISARWITSPEIGVDSQNTWIAFRKEVYLKSVPDTLFAQIAADSKYWLWINGDLVVFEGGLKRGPNPKDTYYDVVDISHYLKKGNNRIVVLLWYFGKDGFSHKSSGRAGLLFNAVGNNVSIISNNTWKCRIHPAYSTASAPYPNFRLPESNILFDARLDIPGWQIGLGDFLPAKELGIWGDAPWNILLERPIPQWKDYGMKRFKDVRRIPGRSGRDTIVAVLPYNTQMTPYFSINDKHGGAKIEIWTDNTYAAGDINLRAEYISRKGKQEYESLGWLNGHKVYFVLPDSLEVKQLLYRETGYDTEISRSFVCDDTFYNKFWAKALRTLYVNMRDTYFDCPERERAQWWGDEVILMGESFYTCSSSVHALMKKGIHELIAWQKKDGSLFSPIPAGNYDSELPGQMLASVGFYGFWNYYMNTGDRQTICDIYPGVRKYLGLWTLDETGLTGFRSGGWSWGDWGDNKDIRLILAGWHYLALKGASNMAKLLGKEQDALGYEQIMEKIKVAYNACWDGEVYRHPEYKDKTDDRVQALAVVSGIADSSKYKKIVQFLKANFHASPYMEKYVMEALFIMGEGEYAMRRIEKRFGPMVNNENYTTLFEGWDVSLKGFGGGTVNHAWSGGPLIVIAQYLCGIIPLSAGWKEFKIAPNPVHFTSASIEVPSISGKISSSFQKKGKTFVLKIVVPEGTTAHVELPVEIGQEVRALGKKYRIGANDIQLRTTGGYVMSYKVCGGKYRFEVR
ncbi:MULTISPECIES: alpha-L-rhamnosidase C-terminal domain-containing protein [Bacteroidales]|jgi:hypothetical protein|uniref:alpha-L-rhamnosidase-related protein n=2 Tax=Bacteroidia TaxID=200643 RepID=UPI000693489D|nr:MULTISPECIES: alpha-L-rhamnosidase C-terminal domain-containing protein [Bacteroidales]